MELPHGIDSKFRFILVAAKRAHQLIGGPNHVFRAKAKSTSSLPDKKFPRGLFLFKMTDSNGHDLVRAATVKIS